MTRVSVPRIKWILVLLLVSCELGVLGQDEVNNLVETPEFNFFPSHYDIEIRLVPEQDKNGVWEKDTAPGKVKILGRIGDWNRTGGSSFIYLQTAEHLEISEKSLVVKDKAGHLLPVNVIDEKDNKLVKIEVKDVKEEEIELSVEYVAKITPFHWSTVKNGSTIRAYQYQGESAKISTYFATVQTIPELYAPQLFPCINDPYLLSTFQLTIIRKSNYSSISNTKLISSSPDPEHNGWVQDKFQQTFPMTLRSVAFVVSEFEFIERVSSEGTSIRLYAPKFILQKYGRANFTLDAAVNVWEIYSSYFKDQPLTLKKIDIFWRVDEPAMEKPGLISYPAGNVMRIGEGWDIPTWSEDRHNQISTLTILGPLLQQFFASQTSALHTPRVWPLPEPIQPLKFLYSYLKELAMGSLDPQFLWNGTLNLRVICTHEYGISRDHFFESRILCDESILDDGSRLAENVFSTMRLLSDENIFGKEILHQAILAFKRKLNTQTGRALDEEATKNLFLDALQEQVSKSNVSRLPEQVDVKPLLNALDKQLDFGKISKRTKQFMLLKVDVVNDTHIQVRADKARPAECKAGVKWYIPVVIQTENGIHSQFWLTNTANTVVLSLSHANISWIMVNPNTTSIHRTQYDPILLQKLQMQLERNHTVFSSIARIRLINDYFHFLHMNSEFEGSFTNISVASVLSLTNYLDNEKDLLVWAKVLESLNYFSYNHNIYIGYMDPPHQEIHHLNNYFREKLAPVLNSTNVKNLYRHPKSLLSLEAQLLFKGCKMGSPVCVEKAQVILSQWKATPNLYSLNERLPAINDILGVIVMGGGQQGFDFVMEQLIKNGKLNCDENPTFERSMLVRALVHTRDVKNLQILMNIAIQNTTSICKKEGPSSLLQFVAERMSEQLIGVEMYRRFFYKSCDQMAKLLPHPPQVGCNIAQLFPKIFSLSQLKELESFVQSKPICLSTFSKEQLAKKILYYRNEILKFDGWMNSTGHEVFAWFGKSNA